MRRDRFCLIDDDFFDLDEDNFLSRDDAVWRVVHYLAYSEADGDCYAHVRGRPVPGSLIDDLRMGCADAMQDLLGLQAGLDPKARQPHVSIRFFREGALFALVDEAVCLAQSGLFEDAAHRLTLLVDPKYKRLCDCDAAYTGAMGRIYGPHLPPPAPDYVQTSLFG